MEDGARADEAHARQDLRGEARGVAAALGDPDGQVGEEDSGDTDEDVRAQARGLALHLALDPDGASEQHGQDELDQKIELERVEFGRDHELVPVRVRRVTPLTSVMPRRLCSLAALTLTTALQGEKAPRPLSRTRRWESC